MEGEVFVFIINYFHFIYLKVCLLVCFFVCFLKALNFWFVRFNFGGGFVVGVFGTIFRIFGLLITQTWPKTC